MLHRVAEENRCVDQRVVEGVGVRLVFEQRLAVDAQEFQAHAHGVAEEGVCSGMGRTIRETDQRLMPAGQRVDTLGVLRGKPGQDLHLRSCQPVAFGMGVAHRPFESLGFDRALFILLRLFNDRLQMPVKIWICLFKSRGIFHKSVLHLSFPPHVCGPSPQASPGRTEKTSHGALPFDN